MATKQLSKKPSEDEDVEELPIDAAQLARKLKDVEACMKYIHAGKATFTLQSKSTGTRFTYRVIKDNEKKHHPGSRFPYDPNLWFVRIMYGPDNEHHYRFIGTIKRIQEPSAAYEGLKITSWKFFPTTGFAYRDVSNSKGCKAFQWLYGMLTAGKYPESAEIWHSGTCGHCGKLLTVPSSIESGIGPICASKM